MLCRWCSVCHSTKARSKCSSDTGADACADLTLREAYFMCGRRSGKSRIAALVAVFIAAFRDHSKHLAPGERGVVSLLAADRKQAGVVLGYVAGLIDSTPMLAAMVVSRTSESIELSNGITIEVHTSSYRRCAATASWR